MASRGGSQSPGEQLEDLQRRYQLLEGEKRLNHETSSVQLKANKDAIRRLNETNNKLRGEITRLSTGKSSDSSSSVEEVIKLKNRFNAIRADNAKKELLLEQLKNQLDLRTAASSVEENSVLDRRIRVLENRIDKAMIKYNEAQSIKKTYEGILHRLKEERVGFDHQLQELEKQLEAKKKDYEELVLLSHDATHAKEMAQAELHRFEQAVMEERNQRDREVMEKKLLVQQRVEMNHKLDRKEKEIVSQNLQVTPHTDNQPEIEMDSSPTLASDMNQVVDEDQKVNQRLSEYEEAYGKLKEITGVNDVNEIIQKFIAQEVTHTNLEKLSKEQQQTLSSLNEEHEKLRMQLDELKYSGSAAITNGPTGKRTGAEDAESLIAESYLKLEKNRSRYEKLAKILIDVNAGVGHLHDKLACIRLDGRHGNDTVGIVLSDETVEEVLNMCELKISKLIEAVSHSPMPDEAEKEQEYLPDIRVRGPGDGPKAEDIDFDAGAGTTAQENEVFNRKLFKSNSEVFVEKNKKYVEFKVVHHFCRKLANAVRKSNPAQK